MAPVHWFGVVQMLPKEPDTDTTTRIVFEAVGLPKGSAVEEATARALEPALSAPSVPCTTENRTRNLRGEVFLNHLQSLQKPRGGGTR